MLLLSCPRSGHRRRASLLLLGAVLLCVVAASASLPAGRKCPPRIDCAKEGRHFCRPGSSQCGSCISPLEETKEGRCTMRKRHHQYGKVTFYSNLDEDIDYLHSVIEKQAVSEIKPSKKQSKHPAAAPSQTDVEKSQTDASEHKQKSQARLLGDAPHATTTAPLPNTTTPQPGATGTVGRAGPIVAPAYRDDRFILIVISLCVVVGIVAMVLATICYVKFQRESRQAQKVDYPAFKGAGKAAATANGTSMGDKTLAQNAQMYHFQHQKQQMLSVGNQKPEQKVLDTEITSDEEEVGGDFTVYECPGLAPTGEMEVKNPLFDDSNIDYQGNHK